MKLKEAYIQYDAAKDLMYYRSEDSSISMNSSDEFYVRHEGQWHWTRLCWAQDRGWYLGAFPDWDIQTGQKIPMAVKNLFEGVKK